MTYVHQARVLNRGGAVAAGRLRGRLGGQVDDRRPLRVFVSARRRSMDGRRHEASSGRSSSSPTSSVDGERVSFFVVHDAAWDEEVKANGGRAFRNTAAGTLTDTTLTLSGAREQTGERAYKTELKRVHDLPARSRRERRRAARRHRARVARPRCRRQRHRRRRAARGLRDRCADGVSAQAARGRAAGDDGRGRGNAAVCASRRRQDRAARRRHVVVGRRGSRG